jgi:hypothetical protein
MRRDDISTTARPSQIDAPTEKAHRHRGGALAATVTAETEARLVFGDSLIQETARLAGIVSAVENAATGGIRQLAFRRLTLRQHVTAIKKAWGLAGGHGPLLGSLLLVDKRLPQMVRLFKCHEGDFYPTSRCVTASVINTLGIGDRAHCPRHWAFRCAPCNAGATGGATCSR